MANWQPIETAPKDGVPVLLFSTEDMDQIWPYRAGWWDFGSERWVIEYRPRPDIGEGVTEDIYIEIAPTHWQPLPEPPTNVST